MVYMEEIMMYTIYLEGLNSLLLIVLLNMYLQNYRALKSAAGVGLMVFAGLLLIQNLVGIYLHLTTGEFYALMHASQVFVLKLIETVGLGILAYSAWKE